MNHSISKTKLTCLLLTVTFLAAAGCQAGKFSGKPNLAFWKKDELKLSPDSIAPPSRHFQPESTQIASTAGSDTKPSAAGSGTKPSAGSGTKPSDGSATKPIREPYQVQNSGSATKPAAAIAQNNFGFPEGSKTLFGNNDKAPETATASNDGGFKIPKANEFRQALQGAVNGSNDFVAKATNNVTNATANTAEGAFQATKQLTNNSLQGISNAVSENANGFRQQAANAIQNTTQNAKQALSGGAIAQKSSDFVASASNAVKSAANQGATWKNDFKLPNPKIDGLKNELVGNDFGASVKQASQDAQKSFNQFNQQALQKLQPGFANTQQAAPKLAEQAKTLAGNFQAKAAQAQDQFQASSQKLDTMAKPFTIPVAKAPVSANSQTSLGAGFQPAKAFPVTPRSQPLNLPSTSPDELAKKAHQLQRRLEGSLSDYQSGLKQAASNTIDATNDVVGNLSATNAPVSFQQQPGQYPQTNFSSYASQAQQTATPQSFQAPTNPGLPSSSPGSFAPRQKLSVVEDIAEPQLPILKPSTPSCSNSRLPSAILEGKSSYAPGSVRSLAPLH